MTEGSQENKLYLQNFTLFSSCINSHQANIKHDPDSDTQKYPTGSIFRSSDRFFRRTIIIFRIFFFHYQNTLSKSCLQRQREKYWTTEVTGIKTTQVFSSHRLRLIAGFVSNIQETETTSPPDVERFMKVYSPVWFLAPLRDSSCLCPSTFKLFTSN